MDARYGVFKELNDRNAEFSLLFQSRCLQIRKEIRICGDIRVSEA